jgi:thiamine biosynthesis lipoprotein
MPSPTPAPDLCAYGAADWRALGTYVQLVVAGGDKLESAQAVAVRVLSEIDRACSRFRSDSDLTRANANAGSWTQVDPLLAAAVAAAVRAAEQTEGLVDPTLGRSLAAIGYNRDIAAVQAQPGPAGIPLPALPGAWSRIGIDPTGGVLVPEGVALDLGATGKAFTSDLIAASIVREVGAPCVISVGGDVAVGIAAEGPVPWRIAVSELPEADPAAMVLLPSGGLATSTTTARRWRRGNEMIHHLLDPVTGYPVTTNWRAASIAASTCVAANTASTAAILLGAAAPAWLERFGVTGRLVDTRDNLTYVGSWLKEEV